MRSVIMLAIVGAAMCGCLVHERPVEETDASTRPDAFVGHDAARVPVDAFAPDSPFPPFCTYLRNGVTDTLTVSVDARACDMDAPECWTYGAAGAGLVHDFVGGCAAIDLVGDPVRLDVANCAPYSTHTIIRATLVAVGSGVGGVVRVGSDGETCTTTPAMHVGDVADLTSIEWAALGDGVSTHITHFAFLGEGASYQVEVCAIGPCP